MTESGYGVLFWGVLTVIDFVRESVTRVRVEDLEAWATELLGKRWRFSQASGHRGEQSIDYIVTGQDAKPESVLGVLNAACREKRIPAGLVIVDCHRPRGVPYWQQRRQMAAQDRDAARRFASMAAQALL
ncbi:MAG TPA: hypothetical protein VHD36_12440 [Pirellulales bacterium]|nr:hypothetical protein [Pirellulales bacterium]